ncbi:RNA polymerase sigma factor [Paraneptunicella aestuarii]|uniref:RNA polymerase sigma factor n=1 Tax=Paraneptunicella aestuarii TaxID=2831148 RepID=UPI001E58B2F0|nr:RNA polymerase sigma factor [Paraneptunicella aestuarii]UAA40391.1 RNA polymerase sigma factor [Paraneptunicella aestuarii]
MSIDNKIHRTFMAARTGLSRMISRIVPLKEVEDIVQETYVRLCQLEVPEQVAEPRSFLYKTAKNLALDHLKRAETRLSDSYDPEENEWGGVGELESEVDTTFATIASNEEFSHFCDAVRELPVQCRRAFVLKKVYGYSQKEIAQAMDISESTVEKHIATGIKRCTQHMFDIRLGKVSSKQDLFETENNGVDNVVDLPVARQSGEKSQ